MFTISRNFFVYIFAVFLFPCQTTNFLDVSQSMIESTAVFPMPEVKTKTRKKGSNTCTFRVLLDANKIKETYFHRRRALMHPTGWKLMQTFMCFSFQNICARCLEDLFSRLMECILTSLLTDFESLLQVYTTQWFIQKRKVLIKFMAATQTFRHNLSDSFQLKDKD